MDKVSEQLVGAQITAGFDRRMYEYSSAYRKAHSCETTLINLKKVEFEKVEVETAWSLATTTKKKTDTYQPITRPVFVQPDLSQVYYYPDSDETSATSL